MADLNEELRELLRRKANEVPHQIEVPPGLKRQVSRRRMLKMGGAATLAVTVIAAIAIPVATRRAGPPVAIPGPGECAAPPLIGPAPVTGAGAWGDVALPAKKACSTLTATKRDASGVAPDSRFILVAAASIDVESVKERLQIDPPLKVRVAKDGTKFNIDPEGPLAEDTVYRFTLLDGPKGQQLDSWSFQTRGRLRVVQTLPADQATNVPIDIAIELTFSHDGATGVEERLSIVPKVEGRIEAHKRTFVFVPKKLNPATLYTVTLKSGVRLTDADNKIEQDFTFRFETGTSKRGESARPLYQFSRSVWESPTGDHPALGLFSTRAEREFAGGRPPPEGTSLPLTVYRFGDADGFLKSLGRLTEVPFWASISRQSVVVPTDGLAEVASFDARLERAGSSGEIYVRFPRTLPAGFYLVTVQAQGGRIQTWLQVTDLATYASVSERRSLVWVNDVKTKGPAEGATVRTAGADFSTKTGADGVAFFDTPKALLSLSPHPLGQEATDVRNLIITSADGRTGVVPLAETLAGVTSFEMRENEFPGDPSPYWRFLYTDRNLYRLTDTVNFWGLVRSREGPVNERSVVVELIGRNEEGVASLVARTTVTTTPAGTYIGKLAFRGASPGFYELRAKLGDQIVDSAYFEIRDFTTPAYSLDVVPDKEAVFSGDEVNLVVRASFFEGTPVPNVRLMARGVAEQILTTDASGRAALKVKTRPVEIGSSSYESLEVGPELAEEGDIFGGGFYRVFAAALDFEAEAKQISGKTSVEGTAYGVDLRRINENKPAEPDDYRSGPSAGRKVVASVTEHSYRQVEEGEYYDFVSKVVRKRYRYESESRPAGSYSATTDSKGRFSFSFPSDSAKSYVITVAATDDSGRTVRQEIYGSQLPFGEFGESQLIPETQGPYGIGDKTDIVMRKGASELPSGGDNRYLFMLAGGGIKSFAVQTSPRFGFTFGAEHIPNVQLAGVRYNGLSYEQTSTDLHFDKSGRELDIEVKADRERYRPGEDARLAVKVTDRGGRPVEAEVLLSAVDEAVYRAEGRGIYEDGTGILGALYRPVDSGVLRTYAFNQEFRSGETAEGGEGAARKNFKDLAMFDRVHTGPDGRASAVFHLPDNLTSWRVGASGVTEDLHAGSNTVLIPVGLPLYADVVMNTSYLTEDRPMIRMRAFGDALSAGDAVAFTVEVPALSSTPIKSAGTAFAGVDVALPPLKEGVHKLTVRVASKNLSDAIERTFSVVPSRLLASKASFFDVKQGEMWKPPGDLRDTTRITLTDHNRGRWYPDLVALAYTSGDRVDQMLARSMAQEMLTRYFGESPALQEVFQPASYRTKDGGIAILPFADDDLVVSARVAALAPERFGRQDLLRYFHSILGGADETRERAVIALYGLAALGEPVLIDVTRAAAGDLTPRERLYIGLAAAELGDVDTAEGIYRKLLLDFGQIRGDAARLDVPGDSDDVVEASSLAAILGAALSDSLAPTLENYLRENYAEDFLVELEKISFLEAVLPRLSAQPVRFSYVIDGKRAEEELAKGESKSLSLSSEALAVLDLRAEKGILGVGTSHLVRIDPASSKADKDLSLERIYRGGAELAEGTLVRITLKYGIGGKAVAGCHRVTDLLPSGLRPVAQPYRHGIEDPAIWFPYAIDGQRVSFCASKKGRPIVYYARVIGKGAFLAEPALMQAVKAPDSITFSKGFQVNIK